MDWTKIMGGYRWGQWKYMKLERFHSDRGFVDQCGYCAVDVERYVASRGDGKHGTIEIHRENLATVKAVIKSELVDGVLELTAKEEKIS